MGMQNASLMKREVWTEHHSEGTRVLMFCEGYRLKSPGALLRSFTDRDLGTGVDEKKERKRKREQYPSGYMEDQ